MMDSEEESPEGQGAKQSIPISTEEKKMLAAERKRRYHAARFAAKKEKEQQRDGSQRERIR